MCNALRNSLSKGGEHIMSKLIYDEKSLVEGQLKQYDKFLHSRINKYNGAPRTLVTYFSINDEHTTLSLGLESHYQILGKDSPLRFDRIEDMMVSGLSPFSNEDTQASTSQVRNFNISGECIIWPNTIMPKENDMFILNHIKMNHIFRVTNVMQDGLFQDGSYKISYSLFSTNHDEIEWIDKQTVGKYVMDLQTIGGEDLTPVISKTQYELRSRLMFMIDEMIQNYNARYYDRIHNCYLLHLNGMTLFDPSMNMFMAKHGTMMMDNHSGNIVLNKDKLRYIDMEMEYQRSPWKWLERECPYNYCDTFKFRTLNAKEHFLDSTFALYGQDVEVMLYGDAFCGSKTCDYFFPIEAERIFESECDTRECDIMACKCCKHEAHCNKPYHLKRYDYLSIINDYIHRKLTSIDKLSLFTGDVMFDNGWNRELYLWTPFVIHILKQTLKIK